MTRKLFVFQALLVAAALAATAILYPHLSERVATHWNAHGQPNGYSSRESLFFFVPGMLLVAMLLTALLPWLSPRHFEVDAFASTYRRIMCYITIMFAYFDAVILWLAAGRSIDGGRAILGGACLFIALIGNVLGKVRRNFFVGVRTPWTLASEKVWNSTHRMAGKSFVAAGLLGLAFAIAGLVVLPIVCLVVGALVPVVYSLVYYKQLEQRGELESSCAIGVGDQ
jgi:uncharacterized membrane protein